MAVMQDIGASILARLKNKAKVLNVSYQQCLQLFFQEEFLRRLAKSPYANNFILKGGLFIYTLTNFQSRSTVDIDFLLQRQSNDINQINKIIVEIISIPTGLNDIVVLEAGKTEPIAVQMKYHGISTQITGRIKKVRVAFGIDIGTGDVIVPKPEKRIIQTQLEGYEAPEIFTYSLESTIAEKFDAMLQRFELTSRMKDFHDIAYLAQSFDFEGQRLQEALSQTLRNRGTLFESDSLDKIVRLADDPAIQVRWRHFQKIIHGNDTSLNEVIGIIDIFLRPVCEAIITGTVLKKNWKAELLKWT